MGIYHRWVEGTRAFGGGAASMTDRLGIGLGLVGSIWLVLASVSFDVDAARTWLTVGALGTLVFAGTAVTIQRARSSRVLTTTRLVAGLIALTVGMLSASPPFLVLMIGAAMLLISAVVRAVR